MEAAGGAGVGIPRGQVLEATETVGRGFELLASKLRGVHN